MTLRLPSIKDKMARVASTFVLAKNPAANDLLWHSSNYIIVFSSVESRNEVELTMKSSLGFRLQDFADHAGFVICLYHHRHRHRHRRHRHRHHQQHHQQQQQQQQKNNHPNHNGNHDQNHCRNDNPNIKNDKDNSK